MRNSGSFRWVLPPLALLALFALSTAAASEEKEPVWLAQLERQALKDENCKVLYTTSPREYDLLGQHIVEVRIHCDDGRSFDATRKDAGPFTFAACEPVMC